MGHCTASPSSSDRWIQCTGSLYLIQRYPPPLQSSPALEQGSKLHNVASEYFHSENPLMLSEQYKLMNKPLESSMYEYYKYVRNIQSTLSNWLAGAQPALHIETKVSLDNLMEGMYGTPDAVIYNDDTLHVIDLKTGRIPIKAEENSQLMLYAYGAIKTYNLSPKNITLHIYQKNELGDNIQQYSPTVPQLYTFTECVRSVLRLYNRGILKYQTGSHCHYCPVSQHCPSRVHQCLNNYVTLSGTEYTLDVLTVPEMIRILAVYKDLEPFINDIQSKLLGTKEEVLNQHNMSIKTRKSPRKYNNEAGALQALKDCGAPLDEVAPRTLLSPSKLKQLSTEYYEQAEPFMDIPTETKYLKFSKNPLESIDKPSKKDI